VIGSVVRGRAMPPAFAQLASEWRGGRRPVRLVTDDSDRVSVGGGSLPALDPAGVDDD